MKRQIFSAIIFACFMGYLSGQGLFESAQASRSSAYELGGEIRSGLRIDHEEDSVYTKELYSRAALSLRINAGANAYAYANIAFENGYAAYGDIRDVRLREAFIDLQNKTFHLRAGKQIESWGRADAFSPLDCITPKDLRRMHVDPDNMRLANYLINSSIQFAPSLRLQGIWIPFYRENELPLSMLGSMEDLNYEESIADWMVEQAQEHGFDIDRDDVKDFLSNIDIPLNQGMVKIEKTIKNSGFGLRCDLFARDYDAAFSYLNSYSIQPVFRGEPVFESPSLFGFLILQQPWRQHIYAFDAAFNAGAWSFRFEGALTKADSLEKESVIPEKELELTLGIDRFLGPLHILAEYNAKHIPDFWELEEPDSPMEIADHELAKYNRLIFRQNEKNQHNIFIRLSLSLFHDTFEIEAPFMYYFSSKEYLLTPQIRIDLADALSFRLGANIYHGDEGTLFALMKDFYKGYFAELKLTF